MHTNNINNFIKGIVFNVLICLEIAQLGET
jgi:formate/nitrite transporter FocA (FNT family)